MGQGLGKERIAREVLVKSFLAVMVSAWAGYLVLNYCKVSIIETNFLLIVYEYLLYILKLHTNRMPMISILFNIVYQGKGE
jgi:hypothetical protein